MRFTRMAQAVLILAYGLATSFLSAQETAPTTQNVPSTAPLGGLRIRSASVYATYESTLLPNGSGFLSTPVSLPADIGLGGSVAVDWMNFTERSSTSLNYTSSYTGYLRNSYLNALNHALSLTTRRKLAPRWLFQFSLAGNLSSLEQSIFSTPTLSSVASTPSTFKDLAAATLASKFANNPQLATVLTTSPLLESPVSNLVYGQRMLTSSASAALSYSYSPRLSLTFSGGASRAQYIAGDQLPGAVTTSLLSNTTSGQAGIGLSYSLSPWTQLNGSVTTVRVSSSIYDAYTTTALLGLGRTFRRHWIVQTHGGMGVSKSLRQFSSLSPPKPAPAVGGSLAYKTGSHTFLASADRTVSDSYGLGASTSSSSAAAWHWRRLGNSWWLDSSVTWQQLRGGPFNDTSGWHTTIALSRAIGPYTIFVTQYAHLSYSGSLLAAAYHTTQDAVRISILWDRHPTTFK
jgi:hypothetical protein